MFGFNFIARTPSSVEVSVLGKIEKYEILEVIEFTSQRKRMSVIVKTPDGSIKLYCKVSCFDIILWQNVETSSEQFGDQTPRLRHSIDFRLLILLAV